MDESMRTMIGYASMNLRSNIDDARLRDLVEDNFPDETGARHQLAIRLAKTYKRQAERAERSRTPTAGAGKIPRAYKIGEFITGGVSATPMVSVKLLVKRDLGGGASDRISLIVNVPSDTSIPTIIARAGQGICSGVIQVGRGRYPCQNASLTIIGLTPYARHTGYALDVAPITKSHPNPYTNP